MPSNSTFLRDMKSNLCTTFKIKKEKRKKEKKKRLNSPLLPNLAYFWIELKLNFQLRLAFFHGSREQLCTIHGTYKYFI